MQTIKKIRENTIKNLKNAFGDKSHGDLCKEIDTTNQIIKECANDNAMLKNFAFEESEVLKGMLEKYNRELDVDRNNLEALKLEENEDLKTLQDLTNQLERLKSEEDHKGDALVGLKNTMKAYKVLTNTSFLYCSENVTGLMNLGKENNSLPRSFNYDKSKLTQEEITNNLWNMMEEIAGEDWSNVINLTGNEINA